VLQRRACLRRRLDARTTHALRVCDVARSPEASIVEILFLAGRTIDQKKLLFGGLRIGQVSAGFHEDDIMVALTENTPTDWSLGRGLAYGDKHKLPNG
jgi:hypothetical protein